MSDQADQLRLLMHGAQGAAATGSARLLVVAGAKGGVGTTTIAFQIAVALAQTGTATVLVDGDLGKASLAAWCGRDAGPTIADVLSGRRQVEEALQPGPAGVRLLAGAWATGHLTDCDVTAQQRLIGQLRALQGIDVVVIDAGCGQHQIMERFWRAADDVLLVATPDDAAVMDAYGAIKALAGRERDVRLQAVMNQARRHDDACDAYRRLQNACRRFLAIDLPCAATILFQPQSASIQHLFHNASNARARQFTQTIGQLARMFATKGTTNSHRTIQAAALSSR